MSGMRWRSAVATWGGVAWLVLQQFGVPAATGRVARDRDIVLVQEAGRARDALETLPDGRVLTVPLAAVSSQGDGPEMVDSSMSRFSPN